MGSLLMLGVMRCEPWSSGEHSRQYTGDLGGWDWERLGNATRTRRLPVRDRKHPVMDGERQGGEGRPWQVSGRGSRCPSQRAPSPSPALVIAH